MKQDMRQHIYDIPDTYIGAIARSERETFAFSLTENRYYKCNVDYPESIDRLFLEAISNSGNNADETRREGKDPGSIWIWVNDEIITIKNTGNVIPIEANKQHPELSNPEMIFGKLMTSSNYDENVVRMGCGRNGFGAKLINIFSKKFEVYICDAKSKKQYNGVWSKNMTRFDVNEISKYKGKETFVEVKWHLDFNRFSIEKYSEEMINCFARFAVDFSFTCKIPIIFNDICIDACKGDKFVSFLFPDKELTQRKGIISYYEWEEGYCPELNEEKQTLSSSINYKKHIATTELFLLDTPSESVIHSYVNGLITVDGGTHVDSVTKEVFKKIADLFNQKNDKKIGVKDVKSHISIILNCRLPNPTYTSQTKTKLQSPSIKINFPKKNYEKMMKWNFIKYIFQDIEIKNYMQLKKTDGKKSKRVFSTKGEDANFAGSKYSEICQFYIVEGGSASSYARRRRDILGGKDYFGFCAIRGKPLNVTNAPPEQLNKNKEFADIKQYLGLCEGVDYTLPENRKKLRYGKVIICTDADTDGLHICGVLLNFFRERFPSLLEIGMIARPQIAMIKVFDKKEKIVARYYSEKEFSRDKDKYSNKKKYYIQYFKGLATSSEDDVKDDIQHAHIVNFNYDDTAEMTLNFAFNNKFSDVRKKWIEEFDPESASTTRKSSPLKVSIRKNKKSKKVADNEIVEIPSKIQDVTNFVKQDGMLYTMDNLIRAIPMIWDGLKDAQRKLLWEALQLFKTGGSARIKVSQFASRTAADTAYGHAETALVDVTMKMTAKYSGSNNLPYFNAKGLFATRDDCGNKKDIPAGRYPNIQLHEWCRIAYPRDLMNLVPQKVEEGLVIEPEFLPCIIPMHLINGAKGIATGWMTEIVNYKVEDCIEWIRCKNEFKETPKLFPYYNNWNGRLEISDKPISELSLEDEEVSSEIDENVNIKTKNFEGKHLRTIGKYTITFNDKNENIIEITELPIGRSFKSYRKWLDLLVQDKYLKGYDDHSTTEIPHYILYGLTLPDNKPISLANLGLIKSYSMNQMNLIDEKGHPFNFKTPEDILEAYYSKILSLFEELYHFLIQQLKDKIKYEKNKLKFLQLVVDDKLIISKRPKQDILDDLTDNGILHEVYLKSGAPDFCDENIQIVKDEIENLKEEMKIQKSKSPQSMWNEKLSELEECLSRL